MKFLALFVLVAVAASDHGSDSSFNEAWEKYKSTFCKSYGSSDEDLSRRVNFQKNLANINQHNQLQSLGYSSYKLGINKYSDLNADEITKLLMGFRGANPFPSTGSLFTPPQNLQATTTTVDWRKKGLVTEVKDQGQCGCCYAFSATGSLEGQMKKKTGNLVSLSEQNIVDCSQSQGNDGCDGGWMNQAFKYVKSNGGLNSEDSYPYLEAEGNCNYKKTDSAATVSSYVNIPSGDEKALMKAVSTVGPVSAAINADGDFSSYQSGIYDPLVCPNNIQNMSHAVLIVGFGSEGGKDYWIIKNSWGESWGEKGYMRIIRNKNNACGLATKASYPVV